MPLTTTSKPSLFCFSHLRWDFVFQRPQQLLSRAAEQYDVIYFEEPVQSSHDHLAIRLADNGTVVATPHLSGGLKSLNATSVQSKFVASLRALASNKPCVAWYYTPEALTYTADLQFDLTVYDCMDELSNFKGAHHGLREFESALLSISDVVFTGGRSLQAVKSKLHNNVHCFPSSVDVTHFKSAKRLNGSLPADQASIAGPRIGYCAVFDERFDPKMLERVAAMKPEWQFIMIGPVVKISEDTLPRLSNIHWLGQKNYLELPAYFASWDAAFMPFALNDATRFISPTKTPEFLASGLPVVSTAVPDVVKTYGDTGIVEIASSPEEACEKLAHVLSRKSLSWTKAVDDVLSRQSWDQTWRSMNAIIAKALRSQAAGRTRQVGEGHV